MTGTLGRYIFLPVTPEGIYWQLLGLATATFLIAWVDWPQPHRAGAEGDRRR